MIDITGLSKLETSLEVKPSDNLFKELGNNTYDFKDLLSELIDNCIAAKRSDVKLDVKIKITTDDNNKPVSFTIVDNGTGIPLDKFANAITPAGVQTANSLNEHGLGMKQAVAAIGKLHYLVTKTNDETKARLITEFKFGNIDIFEAEFDRDSGTEIAVVDIKPIVHTNASTYTNHLVPYLGARYRRYLKPDNKQMDLTLLIILDSTQQILYQWNVEEVKPVYFHPSTRENRPVIHKFELKGHSWEAELTFGYAPKDETEYEELGIDTPNKFHPYKVTLSRQGLDVILHNRVILFHQLAELEIVANKHNDYNTIRGEINLLKGFHTAITKNSIIHDDHYRECIDSVKKILNGDKSGPGGKIQNYLRTKTYPEEIPEKLLRDRLIQWLANNPLNKKENINKEYVVEGIEGYIDILADNEAWELKVDQANALDVYQLFMYMDIGSFEKGYLIAKDFSPGAVIASKKIKEKHGKEISLAKREQFPINHHPSDSERQDYY